MSNPNVYEDAKRAESYATLEYPGTYFLAFRDLPAIIGRHVGPGGRGLDFGCGTGRSTRFLRDLGFETTGVDISEAMVANAKRLDPSGDYRVIADGDFSGLEGRFDVILSAFAFDNIPGMERRSRILSSLGDLLSKRGRLVILGSTPEIYWHEWASFTTSEFPGNRTARSGEEVYTVMKDVADSRPVVDQIWFPEDYAQLFAASGLIEEAHYLPLGRAGDPCDWISETSVAPWVIYVLRRRSWAE